jgi:2'-5' RNA ligase
MRLFVATRPPPAVIETLAALPRAAADGVRWTTADQWHVTMRFFGNLDDPSPIVPALAVAVGGFTAVEVRIGPNAAMLGRHVVSVPVTGLDDLASSVLAATAEFGEPAPAHPFRGHLTLARTKGAHLDLRPLGLDCTWTVREVELFTSHLGRGGARYETLETFALRA